MTGCRASATTEIAPAAGATDDERRGRRTGRRLHVLARFDGARVVAEWALHNRSPEEAMNGEVFGSYRVVRKLGEGGMGTVYLGEHVLLGRQAAIKVLHPRLSAQRDVVQRFFGEARAASAIDDPGIIEIYDFGYLPDGTAYLIMELLDGDPLDGRLKELGYLPWPYALRIARQVATSLAAAHARGIIHRDLKPDNIYLVRDPEVPGGERAKVLDFGIAKEVDRDQDRARTHAGVILGTPAYMSPEQCRGTPDLDYRSDIYSLGCVLFHLLTGALPFDHEGIGEILAAHLHEAPQPPSARMVGIPPEVDALVLRCLAKAPEDRFADMGALASAIEAVLATIGTGGSTSPYAPTISAPSAAVLPVATGAASPSVSTLSAAAGELATRSSGHRTLWWSLAAMAAVAIVTIAIIIGIGWRQRPTGQTPVVGAGTTTASMDAAAPGIAETSTAPGAEMALAAAMDAGVDAAAVDATVDAAPAADADMDARPAIDATLRQTAPPRQRTPRYPRRPAAPSDDFDGDGIPDRR